MFKVQNFYHSLMSMYPDVMSHGTFSKPQLISMKELHGQSIPGPVWKNKAGRGMYVIPTEFMENHPAMLHHVGSTSKVVTEDASIVHLPSVPTAMKTVASAVTIPTQLSKAFIPDRAPEFVPFGACKDVDNIVSSRIFYPVYITGLSGNGKSTMVEQICAKHKRTMIRVNLNAMSDEDQLIGSKTLVDGNVEIVEGPVIIAMRTGSILLCLEKSEKVRVGTVDNWAPIALEDMEIDRDYPIVSYNMETSQFENDNGRIYTEHSRDDLYEVEFEDGSTITLTSDHPFIIEGNIQKSIQDGLCIGDRVVSMN